MLPLPELLRFGSAEQWRMVLYGFLVVIVILFRPAGIMGTRELTMNDLKSLVGWVKGKFSKNSLKIFKKGIGSMENCEYALEIRDVSKRFGGIVATDHVNIKVRQGQIFGIIGPNGAGKTTLFNMITGVYKPTEGDVMLYGRSIAGKLPYEIARSGIARTFQNIRLFGDLSVYENVHIAYQKNHDL